MNIISITSLIIPFFLTVQSLAQTPLLPEIVDAQKKKAEAIEIANKKRDQDISEANKEYSKLIESLLRDAVAANEMDKVRSLSSLMNETPLETSPFTGKWSVQFRFDKDTAKPNEKPKQWILFAMKLEEKDGNITGDLISTDRSVTGKFSGRVVGDVLRGSIRLSWDLKDWESFTFIMNSTKDGGSGSAVFSPDEQQKHYYSIQFSRWKEFK